MGAPDLAALARTLPASGFTVVRVEQPWHVAGRHVAPPPPRLDEAWLTAVAGWQSQSSLPLVLGGRSAGARVACRTALALGARGVVALAFPLHPPGRPERSRADELASCGVPALVVQGERDPFGGPDDVAAAVPGTVVRSGPDVAAAVPGTVVRSGPDVAAAAVPRTVVVPVPHADHSFRVPARGPVTGREVLEHLVDAVAGWLAVLA